MANWYYIGHYGQLGPLTREQIDELIEGGVIDRETFVWRDAMPSWQPAGQVADLLATFVRTEPQRSGPPPPPSPSTMPPPIGGALPPFRPYGSDAIAPQQNFTPYGYIPSDRSRALAGVLQLLVPGVGRIYLGYAAYGVLQLVLTPCFVGWVWSIIDGILILTGGVKLDGYGRQLAE